MLLFFSLFAFIPITAQSDINHDALTITSLFKEKILNFLTVSVDENRLNIRFVNANTTSPKAVGVVLDKFLGPRPWWTIDREPNPRVSKISDNDIVLIRIDRKWDSILQQISQVQYPMNCEDLTLFVDITEGFDSMGNNFYNYGNNAARNIWGIFTPYIIDPKTKFTNFLDENSCQNIYNKFNCAFIPSTNCSMPEGLEKCGKNRGKCPGPHFLNATRTSNAINDTVAWEIAAYMKSKHKDPEGPEIEGTKYFGLFSKEGLRTSKFNFPPRTHLMAYAFLFRLNYDFRSRIAHEIYKWKASLNPPFPSDGDCVAAHIRRSDRHLKGVNMREWCEKHKIYPNGSCWDDEAKTVENHGNCDHFYDMGCDTAFPFGAMTVSHFLNVSRDVFKKKNIFIMTDDGHAVEEELKHIQEDFKVFRFSAPRGHRKGSTANGVNYLAGLVIASECSAFIGHSGSAVTNFFMNILCVHHTNKWGQCPPFFDFAE